MKISSGIHSILIFLLLIMGCAPSKGGFLKPGYDAKKIGRVGVMKFTGPERIAATAADKFSVELIKLGIFEVFERQQIDKILQEQGFGLTGVTDDQTRKQLGKIANVDALVIGDIHQYAGLFNSTDVGLTIKILDIETGATVYAHSVKSDMAFAKKLWTMGGAIDAVIDAVISDISDKIRK